MPSASALVVSSAGEKLKCRIVQRRELRSDDVLIAITHSGICHSDIHQGNDDWGGAIFPMVPGHEIIGTVAAVGPEVTRFTVGDRVGVGIWLIPAANASIAAPVRNPSVATGMCTRTTRSAMTASPLMAGIARISWFGRPLC